ncbi:hypothetical protein LENED_012485 [Lentinula edodes]|uniref:Uncharacterized protein n=1 Tax=Lentinula edodes TaxID=5353 RepID=A0A1Q3EST2_LENED|nr:hypothetical protein LENED_012485 [Lentinula edodes]
MEYLTYYNIQLFFQRFRQQSRRGRLSTVTKLIFFNLLARVWTVSVGIEALKVLGYPPYTLMNPIANMRFAEYRKSSKRSESCGNESETIVRSASHNYLCR